ncbi:hypothetical protein [Nonomuraea jabiensis]|uniref:hypothetical protein n=1 Tax=Nonomuraea jabiensis TaxID=882448 RepID=UPI003D70DFE1
MEAFSSHTCSSRVSALAKPGLVRSTSIAGVSLIALPYTAATLPLLPNPVSQWLLRLTPAAGFAVQWIAPGRKPVADTDWR